MINRAKTIDLFQQDNMSSVVLQNSSINTQEAIEEKLRLFSHPKRLVFELTNACNINCKMCGRNDFKFIPTIFDYEWLKKFAEVLPIVEEVTLMGWGEPTVHPKFKDILKYLDKFGVRKYFCTNGMKLDKLFEDIFQYNVDIIAISLDGSNAETNDNIRRGASFEKITKNLERIVAHKKKQKLTFPYMNFVFTAMKSNYREIPEMVRLASKIGLEELKVVYLTAFGEQMLHESLYDCQSEVNNIFIEAENIAKEVGINLKLPYIQGQDTAGNKFHKDCYVAWRDFFLGSDGYIRPCMSTPIKLMHIDEYTDFNDIWNSEMYQEFRKYVNSDESMPKSCKTCYQSSYANWNKKQSFIQLGEDFAPDWQNSKT